MKNQSNSPFEALAITLALVLASSGHVSIVGANSDRYNISANVYTKSLKEDFDVIQTELCQGVYSTSN